MKLSDSQTQELKRLISAEFEQVDFESCLKTMLNRDVARIANRTGYNETLGEVIQHAEQENWMPDLLAVLYYERPDTDLGNWIRSLIDLTPGDGQFQGMISQFDAQFDWAHMSRRATVIGRHVCLLEIDQNPAGTAVLVGPNLILTSQHVINLLTANGKLLPNSGPRISVVFDFCSMEQADGTRAPNMGDHLSRRCRDEWRHWSRTSPPHIAEIQNAFYPDDCNEITALDYALIRLEDNVGEHNIPHINEKRSWTSLVPPKRPLSTLHKIHISQHPSGQALKGSTGRISAVPKHRRRIRYTANTWHVSSGSPCWDNDFQLVAIHNFGGEENEQKENQGVPIDPIIDHLAETCGREIIVCPVECRAKPNAAAPQATESLERMWKLGADYPILNRYLLQELLTRVVGPRGSQLLLIHGPRHSGRSFTVSLIQQFLRPFGHTAIKIPGPAIMSKSCEEILADLRSRLSLPSATIPVSPAYTTRPQIDQHLLSTFLGDINDKGKGDKSISAATQIWLIFDSLDDVEMSSDAHDFISNLADRLSEAPKLRLVLIGYSRDLPSLVEDTAETEEIAEIGYADVEAFLKHECDTKYVSMDPEDLQRLAQTILSSATSDPAKRLSDIAKLIRDLARKMVA